QLVGNFKPIFRPCIFGSHAPSHSPLPESSEEARLEGVDAATAKIPQGYTKIVSSDEDGHSNDHGDRSCATYCQRKGANASKELTRDTRPRDRFAFDADHGQQGKAVPRTISLAPIDQSREGLRSSVEGTT